MEVKTENERALRTREIRITAGDIEAVLDRYDKLLGMTDFFSSSWISPPDVIKKLSEFNEKFKNKIPQYELTSEELLELANILRMPVENDTAANQTARPVIEILKIKIKCNKLESICQLPIPEQQKIDIYNLFWLYPDYTEKNAALFYKYPAVVSLLNDIKMGGILNEDIYIEICANAQHSENIAIYFSHLKILEIYKKDTYLAVCKYAKAITSVFLILKERGLERGLVSKSIHRCIYEKAEHAEEILTALTILQEIHIVDEKNYLAACKNIEYAEAIASVFSILQKNHIADTEVYVAVCKNIEYTEAIASVFSILQKNHIVDKNVYLAVCQRGINTKMIISAFSQLSNNRLLTKEICLNICRNTKYSSQIREIYQFLRPREQNNIDACCDILQKAAASPFAPHVFEPLLTLTYAGIDDINTFAAVCEKSAYTAKIESAFYSLRDAKIKDKRIWLAVCEKAVYADKLKAAFQNLRFAGIYDIDIYLAVCEKAEYADILSEAFSNLNGGSKQFNVGSLSSELYERAAFYGYIRSGAFYDLYDLIGGSKQFNVESYKQATKEDKALYRDVCKYAKTMAEIHRLTAIYGFNSFCFRDVCKNVETIFSIFSLLKEAQIENNEINFAICQTASNAKSIQLTFCNLIKNGIRHPLIYLAICKMAFHSAITETTISNITSILFVFKNANIKDEAIFLNVVQYCDIDETHTLLYTLQERGLDYKNIIFAIGKDPETAKTLISDITLIFGILKEYNIINEDIFVDVCTNANHAHNIALSFSRLKEAGMFSEITCNAILKYPENCEYAAKALTNFQKEIGYVNNDLVDHICQYADYSDEIIDVISSLRPTGLVSAGLDNISKSNCKTIFECAENIIAIKPVFNLMIEAGLFGNGYYDIVVMEKIPQDKTTKNIIIIAQKPVALYHFDENGNHTEILKGHDLKALINNETFFTQNLPNDQIKNIYDYMDYKKYQEISGKINDAIRAKGYNISFDFRSQNFKLVCKYAQSAKLVLPLLQRLNQNGHLLQFNLIPAFDNAEYAKFIINILYHLNTWDILSKFTGNTALNNGKYADIILHEFDSLSKSEINFEHKKNIATIILNHPKHAQNIISIVNCLQTADLYNFTPVLNNENIRIIYDNLKYTASVLSACQALLLGNKLNQKNFNLICADPKNAITIALESGGVEDSENTGLKEFKHLKEMAKIKNDSGVGVLYGKHQVKSSEYKLSIFCVLPENIMNTIIINSTDHVLDPETQNEIVNPPHTLLAPIQKILSKDKEDNNKNHKIISILILDGKLSLKFNSPDAAKFFYQKCVDNNNLFFWSYDTNSQSQDIVFDKKQTEYFVSTICELDFSKICEQYNTKLHSPPKM